MKKLWSFISAYLMVLLFLQIPVYASVTPIHVYVDGRSVTFNVKPEIKNSRTFVPMRAVFEALKTKVNWDPASRSIFAAGINKAVILQVNNTEANVGGQSVELDAAPYIKDGRALVPLRFISESLGKKVDWKISGNAMNIYISSQNQPASLKPQFNPNGNPVDTIRVSETIFDN